MLRAFFSLDGRMNRAPYWGYSLLMMVIALVPFLGFAIFKGAQLGDLPEAQLDAAIAKALIVPTIVLTLALVWPSVALMAKRLQDLGHRGALAWAIMAPGTLYNLVAAFHSGPEIVPLGSPLLLGLGIAWMLIGIPAVIYLGFFRGTDGPNDFGPDPLDRRTTGAAVTA